MQVGDGARSLTTLTPTAQLRLAESRMNPGEMGVSAAKKPKTMAEMVRILTAPPPAEEPGLFVFPPAPTWTDAANHPSPA